MKISIQDIPPINYNPIEVNPKYNKYIKNTINDAIKTEDPEQLKRRVASGASAVGSILQYIPHPAAKAIGIGLQIPDLYYDSIDFKENPNLTNGSHLFLDILGPTSKLFGKTIKVSKTPKVSGKQKVINNNQRFILDKNITPGEKLITMDAKTIPFEVPGIIDDSYSAIKNSAIEVPGTIDDGYNAVTNRDLIEDIRNNIKRKSLINHNFNRDLYYIPPLRQDETIVNLPPAIVYNKYKRK